MKMIELVMAKLTSLIKEKTVSVFVADWKLLVDFLHEIEKMCSWICGFYD